MYISDNTIPELAFLGFQWILPHPRLQPYVQCYWLAHAWVDQPRQENFYPDGGTSLVFSFADPVENRGHTIHTSLFQGVERSATSATFSGQTSVLGVRFHPGGVQAFLPIPMPALMATYFPLADLDTELGGWQERLGNLPHMSQRLALLEQLLLERQTGFPRQSLIGSFRALGKQIPHLTVEGAASQLGVTARDLERVFREHVGLTPKQLLCDLRVERARHRLKHAVVPPLGHLAQDAGFFDQSHFIREFKRVVGMTPKHYRKRAESRILHAPSPTLRGAVH